MAYTGVVGNLVAHQMWVTDDPTDRRAYA